MAVLKDRFQASELCLDVFLSMHLDERVCEDGILCVVLSDHCIGVCVQIWETVVCASRSVRDVMSS